jgi:hypothetical protein
MGSLTNLVIVPLTKGLTRYAFCLLGSWLRVQTVYTHDSHLLTPVLLAPVFDEELHEEPQTFTYTTIQQQESLSLLLQHSSKGVLQAAVRISSREDLSLGLGRNPKQSRINLGTCYVLSSHFFRSCVSHLTTLRRHFARLVVSACALHSAVALAFCPRLAVVHTSRLAVSIVRTLDREALRVASLKHTALRLRFWLDQQFHRHQAYKSCRAAAQSTRHFVFRFSLGSSLLLRT